MDEIEAAIRKELAGLEVRKRALVGALRALRDQPAQSGGMNGARASGGKGPGSRPRDQAIPHLIHTILGSAPNRMLSLVDLIARIQEQKPTSPEHSIRSAIHREVGRETVHLEGEFVVLQ